MATEPGLKGEYFFFTQGSTLPSLDGRAPVFFFLGGEGRVAKDAERGPSPTARGGMMFAEIVQDLACTTGSILDAPKAWSYMFEYVRRCQTERKLCCWILF